MNISIVQNPAPHAQLQAILQVAFPKLEYRDLPEPVRADIERQLAFGSPQEAVRRLEDYVWSLGAAERRQTAARGFRKARRSHGTPKAAPRWQRGAHRPRSIESSMQDPRVRGQLAGV